MIIMDLNNLLTLIGICIAIGLVSIIMLAIVIKQLKNVTKPAQEQNATPAPAVQASEDEELVAVITAAIAASLGTNANNLVVKSIRRTENNSPAWNLAGRQQVMNNCI